MLIGSLFNNSLPVVTLFVKKMVIAEVLTDNDQSRGRPHSQRSFSVSLCNFVAFSLVSPSLPVISVKVFSRGSRFAPVGFRLIPSDILNCIISVCHLRLWQHNYSSFFLFAFKCWFLLAALLRPMVFWGLHDHSTTSWMNVFLSALLLIFYVLI